MEFTKDELRAVKEKMRFFEKRGYEISFESECCKEIIDYSNGKITIIVFNGRLYDPKEVKLVFWPERDSYDISWIEFIAEHRAERGEEVSHDLMYLLDYLIEHYEQLADRKYCAECERQYLAYWDRKRFERLNDCP